MLRISKAIFTFCMVTVFCHLATLSHAKVDLKPFFGEVPGEKGVYIKPYREGFVVEFADMNENLVFLPEGKEGYFWGRNSGEIMQGEKYMWAVVRDLVLKIHIFQFDQEGNYKILTYCYECMGSNLKNMVESFYLQEPKQKPQSTQSPAKLEDFFGVFVGQSFVVDEAGNVQEGHIRDIELIVEPYRRGRGFQIEWITVIYNQKRTEVGVRRRSNLAKFEPAPIEGLFQEVTKNNPFKINKSFNLLDGDVLVWSRLDSGYLTTYSLQITDEGTYILKTYARDLTDTGSNIDFVAYEDGEKVKQIRGVLTRVKSTMGP